MAMQAARHVLFSVAIAIAIAFAVVLSASGCGSGGGGDTEPSGRLDALQLEGLVLEPAFDPDVPKYRASLPLCTSKVLLRLQTEASNVRTEVNQQPLPPNGTEVELALDPDITFVQIRLFDPAGRQLGSYEIVLERPLDGTQSYLKASNPDAGDEFGLGVDVFGDTVVVGSWYEDGDGSLESDDSLEDTGAAYVYVRSGDAWPQEAYLKPNLPEWGTCFGCDVGVSDDTIVVGAQYRDFIPGPIDPALEDAGAAYVFVRDAGAWTQQARLLAEHPGKGDLFGASVAVSGDTIVIGAPLECSDGSSPIDESVGYAGAAYVYVRDGVTWSLQAFLKSSTPAAWERFGISVAIAGDTLVVGGFGAAYVFTRSGGAWTHQATLQSGTTQPETWFGQNVAIWDDTIVVGAIHEDSTVSGGATLESAGAAYVFERGPSGWDRTARLVAWNADGYDGFGYSVAVWGDVIVVGAGNEGSDGSSSADNSMFASGAAYLFFRRGAGWDRGPYLKAANADERDIFGFGVAIDRGTVVVTACYEEGDGSDPFDNSLHHAGAAYVFR